MAHFPASAAGTQTAATMNQSTTHISHARGFPDAPGHEVRCPRCNRLLFVARAPFVETAPERAGLVIVCPARRGGWSCKAVVCLEAQR